MSRVTGILESLIENNSIKIHVEVLNWQEAIKQSIAPLIESKSVKPIYATKVIESTIKYGPYYLISELVAMPHARPEDGVNKDSFSLITLKHPVQFDNDKRKIKILVALAATSADIHVSKALPQVVAIFENAIITNKIVVAKSKEEIIKILKSINLNKYVK